MSQAIRRFAIPIVLFWFALAALTNTAVPSLEKVGAEHNVALNFPAAPSMQAMERVGKVFDEFRSDSATMILLEGQAPLGADAHRFYDSLIDKLEHDTDHVEHVQNFWGDPLTAAASQSNDGKAAYVQVFLVGNQGEAKSIESVQAVRDLVAHTPAPPGVKAYVTGQAPLNTDQFEVGNAGILKVTLVTLLVIAVMLFWVYRSFVTTFLILMTVLVELSAAKGTVAVLGYFNVIGLTTYATNLITLLVIAAGTDYAIFYLGRYQEARQVGEDRDTAFLTMYRGTTHVVIGSGLTVAGAVLCLGFCRLPYIQTLGIPGALATLVVVAAAITLVPAVVALGSRFALFEPKRAMRTRGWRRIGTATVRWPGPILVATLALSLVGLLALPGYHTSYNAQNYLPATSPANVGYAAASRHFSPARLNPELLMLEADHDLRNPTDMILLERVAKAVFHTEGIAQVQSITRPLGTPLEHTSIPFLLSANSASQLITLPYQQDRAADMLKQVGEIDKTITTLRAQYELQQQASAATHEQTLALDEVVGVLGELRDKIANVDDFFRPLRSYFYWEPHCFDVPACSAMRNLFDALDGIDQLADRFDDVSASIAKLDELQPKLQALIPAQIDSQQTNKDLVKTNYATLSGIYAQTAAALQNSTVLGQAYDASKTDDSFYLPPEAFDNPEFQRGLKLFLSPDGKAARMIIIHDGDPATPGGVERIAAIRKAVRDAVKGTPLAGSSVYLAGTAAAFKDIQDAAKYDLMIVTIAALTLIWLVILFVTRSLVAAIVIVGTVGLSLGAAFGLSVLVWQDLLQTPLYWLVLPLSIIILLAVGSDYNLLLVSRFKEEMHAGLKTATIRAMAGTGAVVTSAGLVFAATMSSFIVSDLRMLGQVGTTIGLGLLFDTMIVRSFMLPSIATLLGRWFWWPLPVRSRPAGMRESAPPEAELGRLGAPGVGDAGARA